MRKSFLWMLLFLGACGSNDKSHESVSTTNQVRETPRQEDRDNARPGPKNYKGFNYEMPNDLDLLDVQVRDVRHDDRDLRRFLIRNHKVGHADRIDMALFFEACQSSAELSWRYQREARRNGLSVGLSRSPTNQPLRTLYFDFVGENRPGRERIVIMQGRGNQCAVLKIVSDATTIDFDSMNPHDSRVGAGLAHRIMTSIMQSARFDER